jgi:hypothetical protein
MANCDKFWLENPKYLLCDFKVIPKSKMSLEQQMNSLTRLILFVFLILSLLGYKQSILFLILSLTLIIILYYIKRNNMTTYENYVPPYKASNTSFLTPAEQFQCKRKGIMRSNFYTPEVQNAKAMIPNQLFKSANQNLVGGPNPKTMIAPINVAPIYEWNYWKDNDFVIPHAINSRIAQDFYSSGYYTQDCDDEPNKEDFRENYEEETKYENNYYNYQKQGGNTGEVNKASGYNPKNLKYDLPINYEPTDCQANNSVKGLNDQIFTSTVVPGVYYKNEIIEPLNSNIGISFDQQIPPREKTMSKNGKNTLYSAVDPMMYKPPPSDPEDDTFPSTYDVYDPRYNGYGTDSRAYTEKMTGQPRYFYDDVDAIRRPNYIGRSNIDHLKSSYTYGPTLSDTKIFENNKNARFSAEEAFSNQTVSHREEMMTRLMRKRNSEQWQQRLAPLSRASSFSMGGMSLKA